MDNQRDEVLRQQMWELVYDLLAPAEVTALHSRIKSDPTAARLYAEVRLQADLVGYAAQIEDESFSLQIPEEIARQIVRTPVAAPADEVEVATAHNRPFGRSKHKSSKKTTSPRTFTWVAVGGTLALTLLLAVGAFKPPLESKHIAHELTVTEIHAPTELVTGLTTELGVETTGVDGSPKSTKVEVWVLDGHGQQQLTVEVATDSEGKGRLVVPGHLITPTTQLVAMAVSPELDIPRSAPRMVRKLAELASAPTVRAQLTPAPEPVDTYLLPSASEASGEEDLQLAVVQIGRYTKQVVPVTSNGDVDAIVAKHFPDAERGQVSPAKTADGSLVAKAQVRLRRAAPMMSPAPQMAMSRGMQSAGSPLAESAAQADSAMAAEAPLASQAQGAPGAPPAPALAPLAAPAVASADATADDKTGEKTIEKPSAGGAAALSRGLPLASDPPLAKRGGSGLVESQSLELQNGANADGAAADKGQNSQVPKPPRDSVAKRAATSPGGLSKGVVGPKGVAGEGAMADSVVADSAMAAAGPKRGAAELELDDQQLRKSAMADRQLDLRKDGLSRRQHFAAPPTIRLGPGDPVTLDVPAQLADKRVRVTVEQREASFDLGDFDLRTLSDADASAASIVSESAKERSSEQSANLDEKAERASSITVSLPPELDGDFAITIRDARQAAAEQLAAAEAATGTTNHQLKRQGEAPPTYRKYYSRTATKSWQLAVTEQDLQFAPGESVKLRLQVTDEQGLPGSATIAVRLWDGESTVEHSSERSTDDRFAMSQLAGDVQMLNFAASTESSRQPNQSNRASLNGMEFGAQSKSLDSELQERSQQFSGNPPAAGGADKLEAVDGAVESEQVGGSAASMSSANATTDGASADGASGDGVALNVVQLSPTSDRLLASNQAEVCNAVCDLCTHVEQMGATRKHLTGLLLIAGGVLLSGVLVLQLMQRVKFYLPVVAVASTAAMISIVSGAIWITNNREDSITLAKLLEQSETTHGVTAHDHQEHGHEHHGEHHREDVASAEIMADAAPKPKQESPAIEQSAPPRTMANRSANVADGVQSDALQSPTLPSPSAAPSLFEPTLTSGPSGTVDVQFIMPAGGDEFLLLIDAFGNGRVGSAQAIIKTKAVAAPAKPTVEAP